MSNVQLFLTALANTLLSPSVLVYSNAVLVLLEIILLLSMSSDRKFPNLSLMHLTVLKVLPGDKLLTSHLIVLGLISTNLVRPCRWI